jgi:hypothetical protein
MSMSIGELLTRASIWLALAGYVVAEAGRVRAESVPHWERWARWAWTVGGVAYLGHVIAAFHFYHGWSHGAAWLDTARQTEAKFRFHWGGGLYFNYFFTALWLAEIIWWWSGPESYRRRPHRLTRAIQAFFYFMVFNATVVFPTGPVRWFGLAISCGLGWLWIRSLPRRDTSTLSSADR